MLTPARSGRQSPILPVLLWREDRRHSSCWIRLAASRVLRPGRFRDQSRTALPGVIGQQPFCLYPHAILQLRKRHEMEKYPNEPSDEPAHSQAAALQNREILADDCHVAFVEVSERMFRLMSPELPRNQPSDIVPLLDRRLRHTRYWASIGFDRRRIADDEYTGRAFDIHKGPNRHPARS